MAVIRNRANCRLDRSKPKTPVSPHDELVRRAERWLRNKGCAVTIRDQMRALTISGEQPDAIGWRDGVSILIECKVTRSDFLADRKKPFRTGPGGMGDWRYFLCAPGVIEREDLPEGWGLLWATPRSIEERFGVPGNCGWHNSPFQGCRTNENLLLVSALRRLARAGHLRDLYTR